jgi:hypothetical protein
VAWIESHQSLLMHRKTLHAVRLLRANRYQVIGHLHALWWWALDNLGADGWLNGLADDDLAAGAGWDGDPTEFARALTTAGFIDVDGNGERWLHDWYDYAGKLLDRRATERDRLRQKRATAKQQQSNDPELLLQRTPDVAATYDGTVPNRTQQNSTEDSSGADAPPSPPIPITRSSEVAQQVAEVWAYYKQQIQPKARVCPDSKIRTRLKRFSVQDLKDAIDRFRARYWYVAKCSDKGGEWFFESDPQIDKFLLAKPQTQEEFEGEQSGSRANGKAAAAPVDRKKVTTL